MASRKKRKTPANKKPLKKPVKRPLKKRSDFATAAEYKRWKKRSEAAKKGAKTKLKKRIESVNDFRPIRGLKVPPIPDDITIDELKQRLILAQAQLAMEIMTRGFVDSEAYENLHKDMTLALMPSRLRHMGAVTDEMQRMLSKAARKGNRALRKKAREYAEFFDVPLQEVYTLFFSA